MKYFRAVRQLVHEKYEDFFEKGTVELEKIMEKERRRTKRFLGKSGAWVICQDLICKLLDVNKKGLSFTYPAEHGKLPEEFFELDIICEKERVSLKKVPCQIVFESTVPASEEEATRRCGVRFVNLRMSQAVLLGNFLQ
jgi:hypothetical protein